VILASSNSNFSGSGDEDDKERKKKETSPSNPPNDDNNRRRRLRKRVREIAKNIVVKPISYAAPMPQAVASVLKDATLRAVDMAVEEVVNRRSNGSDSSSASSSFDVDVSTVISEAFLPLEKTLQEMEESLKQARESMTEAKSQAIDALEAVQAAAIAQAEGASAAVAAAEEEASLKVIADIYAASDINVTGLSFDDIDYGTSEMAPPFLDEDQCLVPGEPIVRVEKAPENSRRIFAGIDIMASVDDVWNIMTDYEHLQNVIPNLVVNEVKAVYDGSPSREFVVDASKPEEVQCQEIASQMKGALLEQVGGAKVAGINFSARTTLEVREWPNGMPDFAHFKDEMWDGKSRKQRAKEYSKVKLQRYKFPRPFAVSSLPTHDISMQSIENDNGEFRMYQGVWRMQPLPGCAPPGKRAMRLTYAVEVSPRAYLPVSLVEGRIVRDLCTNLVAIRDFVAGAVPA